MVHSSFKALSLYIISILGGIYNLYKVLDRKKINNESDLYMSINLLLWSVLMGMALLAYVVINNNSGFSWITQEIYQEVTLYWLMFAMFITALHGILFKKKINNPAFLQLSFGLLLFPIIAFLAIIGRALIERSVVH